MAVAPTLLQVAMEWLPLAGQSVAEEWYGSKVVVEVDGQWLGSGQEVVGKWSEVVGKWSGGDREVVGKWSESGRGLVGKWSGSGQEVVGK